MKNLSLGIDFGTSGARGIVINEEQSICSQVDCLFTASFAHDWAKNWQQALYSLLEQIPKDIRKSIKAIAINGTSSTVLLCDAHGNPITSPILYNDSRGKVVKEDLEAIAPANHLVLSATSSLAKLYWWYKQGITPQASYFLHQADWLGFLLHGKLGISDYHNALKLGYDVEKLCYPDWLEQLPLQALLPQVLAPGSPVSQVTKEVRNQFDLPSDCIVCRGTTDSIAAFLAARVTKPGEAVTSLGSTLVLKLLSHKRIENATYGIYSHRLGDLWLTGGASNTGGAVLKHFFSEQELVNLSSKIDDSQPSTLDYYPLLKNGDRFPINDPELKPRLTPRPENRVEFLQGLLESMAKIEATGYKLLQQLGAKPLTKVYTAGGGAKNPTWRIIRQRHLQVPVEVSLHTEAAYGTALLTHATKE